MLLRSRRWPGLCVELSSIVNFSVRFGQRWGERVLLVVDRVREEQEQTGHGRVTGLTTDQSEFAIAAQRAVHRLRADFPEPRTGNVIVAAP